MAAPVDKDENSASQYLELLVNAANRISVWKWVAALEAGIIVALIYALIMAIQSMPVRLVPHNFSANNGAYIIKPNGESNAEYMVNIAENDVKLLTDWTPQTVGVQYSRFLNRCTPELFAEKNIELQVDAGTLQKTSYSQVFYPNNRKFVGSGRVQIQGTLIRYAGEKIILQTAGVYTVGYRFYNGMPSITEIQYSKPADAISAGENPQLPPPDPTVYAPAGTTEAAPQPAPVTGKDNSDPASSVAPDPSTIEAAPAVNEPAAEAPPAQPAKKEGPLSGLFNRGGAAAPANPNGPPPLPQPVTGNGAAL